MERYSQEHINRILNNLTASIAQRNHEYSEKYLEELVNLKPACNIKVLNCSNSQIDRQILNYVNSMDSTISLKQITTSTISLPQNSADNNIMNTITSSTESSGMSAKSIDSFNKEIYDKLIGAGNSRDNAKYAATGVSTIQEAMTKLKNRKK